SMRQGDFARPWELDAAQKRVKAIYEKEGYHFATVQIQSVPADSNTVDLRVAINEGREMVVRHIEFEGNQHVASGDLRGAMEETKEKKWWKIFSSSTFDNKKYQEDKKKIVDFYHSHGYRDARIES